KILILYNYLFHYRIPIFQLLAEKCDLTVAYSLGKGTKKKLKFKVLKLPIIKLNRFVIHKDNIYKICKDFDVVIAYGDISWLNYSTLGFYRNRKFKLLYWSIGVSASYNKKFDSVSTWDNIRNFFYKKADALIFYTNYPIDKYLKQGFNKKTLFVAPNTVSVFGGKNDIKDSLLFIGTLYFQKGILTLLNSYKKAWIENNDILPLNIIGSGPDFHKVRRWIEENELNKKINLLGAIYDIKIKAKYFKKAYACLSPNQAGLGVLESMGYGVPFVTMHDSITGGERLNITNNFNGIILSSINELKNVILDITINKTKYLEMGNKAKEYYSKNRTILKMVNGLENAMKYSLQIK
ncbi:glycosyltransferase, partial [Flavobacteriaceae bacterium]|nr:glycosyltransferase [Flavobacteriaceae bacterium]